MYEYTYLIFLFLINPLWFGKMFPSMRIVYNEYKRKIMFDILFN